MDRKSFLGSLFAIAALQALPKIITNTSSADKWMIGIDPYSKEDVPGKGGSMFTVLLSKKWFRDGDVLAVGNLKQKYYYSVDNKTGDHWITEMDKLKPKRFLVTEFTTRASEEEFVNKAMKLFSTTKDKQHVKELRDIAEMSFNAYLYTTKG